MLEDDDLFGELLETVLAGSGRSVDVTVCSSLTEAYMALGGGFDLVVTDWNLPDGSGLDFVKKIRSRISRSRWLLFQQGPTASLS